MAEAQTKLNTPALGKSFQAFVPSFSLETEFIASLFQINSVQDKSTHCKMLQGQQVKNILKIKYRHFCISVNF